MSPLEELQRLDALVGLATELEDLRPIFERMTALARENPDDFEVVLAVDQVRSHLVAKGRILREQEEAREQTVAEDEPATEAPEVPVPLPPAPPPLPPPPAPPPPVQPVPSVPPPAVRRSRTVRAAMIGGGVVLLALLGAAGILFQMRKSGARATPKRTVSVEVTTVPPGASIRIDGEPKCQSNCRVDLPPGNYQLTAVLNGFETATTPVAVVAGNPTSATLMLVAQTPSIHLLSDLESGTVMLDGRPAGELQDGQFILERVAAGPHTVRVVGKSSEAEFSFEAATGQQPSVTGPVKPGGMWGVLVTSMGSQAKVYSTAPLKLALNGLAQGETGPQGLELKDIPAGEQTLSLGEGSTERKLVVSFSTAPALTAFFKKAEVTTGTLVVVTGEDDVTVSLNGKEFRRKTRRGTLRIPTSGSILVHVAKSGFEPEPDQKVDVKKGEEAKVVFRLKALPKFAALLIHNAVPGTQIALDEQALGRVGPDGSLSAANLPPGDHTIEARREGFLPKRIPRSLKAGETLNINGADLALAAATGSLHLALTPADAAVSYRRSDESQAHNTRETTLKLEPGNYVVTVRAPNYLERTETVTVVAGETRTVQLSLVKPEAPKPRPTLNWAGWSKEGEELVRRGGNRVVVCSGPMNGTLTFAAHLVKAGGVFRGGRLRWFIEDATGATQYEVDRRHFQAKGPSGSRSKDRGRDQDDSEKTYAVQVDFTPDRIVHKMRTAEGWVTVDSQPAKVAGDTKFGFLIPGNDEIAISGFHFAPR